MYIYFISLRFPRRETVIIANDTTGSPPKNVGPPQRGEGPPFFCKRLRLQLPGAGVGARGRAVRPHLRKGVRQTMAFFWAGFSSADHVVRGRVVVPSISHDSRHLSVGRCRSYFFSPFLPSTVLAINCLENRSAVLFPSSTFESIFLLGCIPRKFSLGRITHPPSPSLLSEKYTVQVSYNEREARDVCKCLVDVVGYLHDHGIVSPTLRT